MNDSPFPGLLIIAGIALVVALAIYGAISTARRRKQLEAWAAARGWNFSSARHPGLDRRYPAFARLQQGSNRYAYNLMAGAWNDRPCQAFDFHYETYSRDQKGRRHTHHHHFSAVVVDSGLPLRPLRLRPENFFDKLAEFVGWDDIDFESAEFSRKFHVTADDRRWAYDVIHARTMEFLLSQPRFSVQFDRRHVFATGSGRFDATTFERALGVVNGILDRLPDYLLQQIKEQS